MNTVITQITDNTGIGWVFYDGDCRPCAALAGRWERALARRRFRIAPLQAGWVRTRLALGEQELLREVRLLTPDGRSLGGADALVELSQAFWWARWMALVARIPFVLAMMRSAYGWVAARRHCGTVACAVELGRAANGGPLPTHEPLGKRPTPNAQRSTLNGSVVRWVDFLPLIVLPVMVACAAPHAPAWLRMWYLAGALFFGVKWLAWRDAAATDAAPWRRFGFLALWPGMDARRFLTPTPVRRPGRRIEWAAALLKTAFGVVTFWMLPRLVFGASPMVAGWVGMIGLVLGLHFGLFHLLSLAWRAAGVDAPPLMDAPLRATSLAEFWGRRWNLGFSVPARRFVFKPLAARVGNAGALLGVFLVSGFLHELVISVPARGGYGLPAAYFAMQGFGMLAERSVWGRRLGLGAGWRGWLFAFLCTAGPAWWLFHPPFVHRVILPFLQTIGAL